jgi:hypothetical protein
MPPKSEQKPAKPEKPAKRGLIKRTVSADETSSRWRDVTSYFSTLDAETRGLKTLAKQVRAHQKPKNVFERMWCDDIIALSWHAYQLRRIKEYIIFEGARDAVTERLKFADEAAPREDRYNDPQYTLTATLYVLNDAVEDVTKAKLGLAGVPSDLRFEIGYVAKAYELENIDRLIFANEKRRDDLIDRLESRRG